MVYNKFSLVDDFIASLTSVKIIKEIALKTVHFSNSMAEAANRIVKTYYLNHQVPENTKALENYFAFIVYDICHVRPHGQLNGLTPNQAYLGFKPNTTTHKVNKTIARQNRILKNQTFTCCKTILDFKRTN